MCCKRLPADFFCGGGACAIAEVFALDVFALEVFSVAAAEDAAAGAEAGVEAGEDVASSVAGEVTRLSFPL